MKHSREERTEKKDASGAWKKPYQKPSLTIHGDVEKLTRVFRLARAKGSISSDIT